MGDAANKPLGKAREFTDREQRIRALERRQRLGLALWHPADVVHLPPCRRAGLDRRDRKQDDGVRG